MKTKKRLLSILLSLAMVMGLMPGMSLTVLAEDTLTIDDLVTAVGTSTFNSPYGSAYTVQVVEGKLMNVSQWSNDEARDLTYNSLDGKYHLKFGVYDNDWYIVIDSDNYITSFMADNGGTYDSYSGKSQYALNLSAPEATYTVTWKSQDGTETYETDTDVAKDTQPSYDGSAPTKAEDDNYTYTFAGWATSANQESGTAASALSAVTDNVTYYAAFSKTQKQSSTAYDDLNTNDTTVQIEGVKYDGTNVADWYVIGYNSTDQTVTLLSKQAFASMAFNSDMSKGHDYVGSDIEAYVKGLIGNGQPLAGIKDALVDISGKVTGDPDNISGAVPYLLSYAEANALTATKKSGAASNWWLRSPGITGAYGAACVYGGGAFEDGYDVSSELAVRPALKLNLSSVIFSSESNTFTVESATAVTEYPLWVGGVQVTSENASNIDGDNKASYDDSTHTLTLNGYSYTGVGHKENSEPDSPLAAIYYTGTDPLTIQLSGTSSITRTGNSSGTGADTVYGIHCSQGNLTIDGNGSGSLTVTGGELKTAYGIVATTVTIKNANVTSMGKGSYYGTGIYGKQGISIQNATVTAEGKGYGISGDTGSAEIEESSSVTALGSIKAISGTVKNSIAGTGWTNVEGTEGQADIAKSSEGQSFTYKKVQFPAEPWLYNITIPTTENGTVTAKVDDTEVTNETKVEAGKTVALEVTPDSGYKLDTLDIKYEGIIDSEDTVSEIKKDDILSYAQIKAFIETQEGTLNFAQFNIDEEYHNAKYQKMGDVWGFNANGSNMQEQDMSDYNWKCTGGNIDTNVYLFEKAVVLIPITPKQDSTDVNKFTFTMPKGDVTVTATFEPGATAPTIETQPADLELTYGYTEGSVSVEATAAEDHELSYQWYSNTTNNTEGGKVIEGATKASYTIPTGKNADTVEYYYCVVTATFMDKTATTTSDVAEVNVKKADSSVKTAPKARDITYTGKPQALVEGGTAVGGEMQYALGENTTTAPADDLYDTSIPTATDAGTYYVWYKVVGDENYNDVEPACVKVTIAEEKKQDEPVKPNEPDTPAKTVDMYRLYNPNSGEHFYTANAAEKDNLVSLGWTYEGIGWKAPEKSNTPVYRVYNPNAGDHHYTTNKAERDNLISVGWKDEGIGWYSDDTQSLPIYRQYNPNAVSGAHNFTSNKGENDWLVSLGWKGEGIGWYGVK